MDFSHTETRQMLSDTLGRYVLQDYPLTLRLKAGVSEMGYSKEKWSELAELGIIGALFSEDDGGFGGAGFDLAVVFECLGRGLVCEPFLESAVLGGGILACAGNKDQKAKLSDIIAGNSIYTFAHFEANDGFDPTYIETTALKSGDNWLLNGHKAVVRHAKLSDFMIISARSSGSAGDWDGLSLFLVPSDNTGIEIQDYQTIDGSRAGEVVLNNLSLPSHALIGKAGGAIDVIEHVLGRGLLALCAEALGIMDVIKEMTIDYIQTRKQFGVPIGKFQALQHRMAEMLLEIEQARSAVINAAAQIDQTGTARERAISAAKFTIGQVGTLVSEESIQLHGGIGMTWEHSLGHYAKRLTMITHELGDEDYHLARYIRLGRT